MCGLYCRQQRVVHHEKSYGVTCDVQSHLTEYSMLCWEEVVLYDKLYIYIAICMHEQVELWDSSDAFWKSSCLEKQFFPSNESKMKIEMKNTNNKPNKISSNAYYSWAGELTRDRSVLHFPLSEESRGMEII